MKLFLKMKGQQATVFGGGQYDGLVESFGGECWLGRFGLGMERLLDLAKEQKKNNCGRRKN